MDNVGGKSSGGSIREIWNSVVLNKKTGGTATPTPTNGETVETRPQQEEKIVSVDSTDENVTTI